MFFGSHKFIGLFQKDYVMDFKDEKEELLRQGNALLGFVKHEDIGLGIIEDVMDEIHLQELSKWYGKVEKFMEKHAMNCQLEDFKELSWIINQNRVHIDRTKQILALLEDVDE